MRFIVAFNEQPQHEVADRGQGAGRLHLHSPQACGGYDRILRVRSYKMAVYARARWYIVSGMNIMLQCMKAASASKGKG